MKKFFFVAMLLLGISVMVSCEKTEPDNLDPLKDVDDVCTMMDDIAFKKFCYTNLDTDHDNMVSMSEAASVEMLLIDGLKIASLKGLEYFTNLSVLSCSDNSINSLDISYNSRLRRLDCSDNPISSLDLSKNAALEWLDCDSCQLSSLDLSNNTALTYLSCVGNRLSSLDVSQNQRIDKLYCAKNQISSLVLPKEPFMTELICGENQLTSLDVSQCSLLTYLGCYKNRLVTLDVSMLSSLESLVCSNNQLTSLKFNNNIKNHVDCRGNQLKEFDISKTNWTYTSTNTGIFAWYQQQDECKFIVTENQKSTFIFYLRNVTNDKQLADHLKANYNLVLNVI